jgi:hypothetical protein
MQEAVAAEPTRAPKHDHEHHHDAKDYPRDHAGPGVPLDPEQPNPDRAATLAGQRFVATRRPFSARV